MKPLTKEWVRKADEDHRMIVQAMRTDPPCFDHVCFLAQQCAEKYIKAVFQERDVRVERIHDLGRLAGALDPPIPEIALMRPALEKLSQHAVDIRYPGFSAEPRQAEDARVIADQLRGLCRKELGLE